MAIARLVAGGIPTKMVSNAQAIIKLPSYWTMPADHNIVPLSFDNVMLAFILWVSGLGLATLVFVIEIFCYKSENVESKFGSTENLEMSSRNRGDLIMSLMDISR